MITNIQLLSVVRTVATPRSALLHEYPGNSKILFSQCKVWDSSWGRTEKSNCCQLLHIAFWCLWEWALTFHASLPQKITVSEMTVCHGASSRVHAQQLPLCLVWLHKYYLQPQSKTRRNPVRILIKVNSFNNNVLWGNTFKEKIKRATSNAAFKRAQSVRRDACIKCERNSPLQCQWKVITLDTLKLCCWCWSKRTFTYSEISLI